MSGNEISEVGWVNSAGKKGEQAFFVKKSVLVFDWVEKSRR